jgi:hypothetical protein
MEANNCGPTERLWADDEKARERILGIDLSVYDDLITYPAGGVDWPHERKKILFCQGARRNGSNFGAIGGYQGTTASERRLTR